MKTEDTVEYNSLRWVKKELDLILHEAQAALSAYIEDTQDESRLRECIEHLHMVNGTLQMVELYGAAQLSEEMEELSTALLNHQVDKPEDAYDVLMRSMLQLPDYLESIQVGNKDIPMILLPLLNDLRAARNASLLSEKVMFFPDVDADQEAAPRDTSGIESGQLLALAKKLRPHYQVGLLGWFKEQKVRASLKRMLAVLTELEKFSADAATRRVWSISAALTEGLVNEGIDGNLSIKTLMGQVDRSIKTLIDRGEEAFGKNAPADLLKNILYYIARVDKSSERVDEVKTRYRLAELLPDDHQLEEARSGLGGLNTELLRTVSQGIREDLMEVKDSLEIFVHSENRDVKRIASLPELLNKIADTLAMLGLGAPRETVQEQRQVIENIINGSVESSDDEVMGVASKLLNVEAQLNSFIANRSSAEGQANRRLAGLEEMPEAEYQDVLSAVINEALQNFSDARQAILGFLENPSEKSLLNDVIYRLDQVNGAMFMLPVKRLEPMISAVKDYVDVVLLRASQVPDDAMQDALADVVTSVEYYLEAVLEGRPDIELSVATGDRSAEKLNQATSEWRDQVGDAPAAEAEPEAPAAAPAPEPAAPVVEEALQEEPAAQKEAPAETEAASEPAAVEKPAASDRQYAILGEVEDEEILEIFIEEALEELASLNEQIPLWKNDHGNNDALTSIRRSFHTLKGSGRLIGAELIGEFSWAFENMLNRVIDKTRPITAEIFSILDDALGVLPQLIEQLKGNREPVSNVYELLEQAEALAVWNKNKPEESKPASPSPKPEVKAEEDSKPAVGGSAEPDESLASIAEDIDFGSDIDESEEIVIDQEELNSEAESPDLTLSEPEPEEIVFEESDDLAGDINDEFSIDLTEDLEALHLAMNPEDEEAELEVADTTETLNQQEETEIADTLASDEQSQIHIDPVLMKIFREESLNHLTEVRRLLNIHYQKGEPLEAGPELVRALHTLFGSARTAEVDEIASLCGELEKFVRQHQELEIPEINEQGVQLIDDAMQQVSMMLDDLADPSKRLRADSGLLERVKQSTQALTETPEPEVAQPEPEAPAKPVPEASVEPEESLVSYSNVDEELVEIFLEEAEDLLDGCENSLQRWNNNIDDKDSVHDLQRQLHTLKGGARMADLTPVGNLTHALESLVIAISEGKVAFSRDMFNVIHDAMDRLSDMLSKVRTREPMTSAENLVNLIDGLRRGEPVKKPDTGDETEPETNQLEITEDQPEEEEDESELGEDEYKLELLDEEGDEDSSYSLEFSESLFVDDSESQPDTEQASEVSPEFEEELVIEDELIPEAEAPAPEVESPAAEAPVEEVTPSPSQANTETIELAVQKEQARPAERDDTARSQVSVEQVRVRSDILNDLVNNAGEVSVYHARMGQQISSFSFSLNEMNQTVDRLREQLRKLNIETEAQILSRYEKESDQYDADFDPLEMDRFSTMQQLSRSLSETVADIESLSNILGDDVRDAETLLVQESRISTELQEGLMRTRMVHFGGLSSRLRRIVRQTARELDKDVDLEILGESSEVDRTVLDRIIAPMEHMLRNAVSHGIETSDDRRKVGKPEIGHITIQVDREGGDVVIKVVDDGRGIDVDRVRQRALDNGLIEPDAQISDRDVLQFIMHSGFSTAEKVTQISGRGVGMDVVDSEIKQLGGVLEIDTVRGNGTTFTIRLPLTLAINHALLVNAGDDMYAVPLNSIEGVVRLSGPELQSFYDSGDYQYEFAGASYELKHLGYLLSGQRADYSMSGQLYPVLLANVGDQRVALHVDELLGRREIVVKPVGPQLSTVRGVSGATILGDGRVVLILEMNALVLGDSVFHVEEEVTEQPTPEKVIEELKQPLVMVVDDSITIRKVTERMLSRHGMRVVTAKDGVDAVAQLQEQIPDVMLLDIEMPRMDGYEVASHVRNDESLKDIPIIMITSRTGTKHKDKAMEIGVNKYLGKPYQEDELMENINDLIG